MNSTILQIPINKNLRDRAASYAEKMGFSSLQEVVRLFLNKIASGELDVRFEPVVTLSAKNDKRYAKMIEEIETGKIKLKTFKTVEALMEDLHK